MRGLPFAVALFLAASPALAQQPPAGGEAEVEAKAREHFDKGRSYYNIGQYDQAIAEFQQAYLLMKEPLFLFNIAQAYRLKGDCEAALRFYKNYLREQPDPPILEEVEAAVKICEEKRAQQKPLAEPPAEPKPTDGSKPGRGLQIAGFVVMTAGLALVGTGIYFGVQAMSDSDAVSEYTGEWGPEQQDIEERGKRRETLFYVLTGAGAASVVGGMLLIGLGARQAKKSSVAVAPTPGGLHVTWAVAF